MKLFYQLTKEEQDGAVDKCVNIIVENAIEKGLQFEVYDEEDGKELKQQLDVILQEVQSRKDLKNKEEKMAFLMQQELFADTVLELAMEMAHNAFYHESDELILFTDSLTESTEEEAEESDAEYQDLEDLMDMTDLFKTKKSAKLLN